MADSVPILEVAPTPAASHPPRWLEGVVTVYLLILVAAGASYGAVPRFRTVLPDPLGLLPLGVPYFGALGAVVSSMSGLYFHQRDWSSSYQLWHLTRPIVGIVLGVVGYLVLVVIVQAVGSTPGRDNRPFFLAAFLVGYSEARFRRLLERAGAKLFQEDRSKQPGPPGGDPSASSPQGG